MIFSIAYNIIAKLFLIIETIILIDNTKQYFIIFLILDKFEVNRK